MGQYKRIHTNTNCQCLQGAMALLCIRFTCSPLRPNAPSLHRMSLICSRQTHDLFQQHTSALSIQSAQQAKITVAVDLQAHGGTTANASMILTTYMASDFQVHRDNAVLCSCCCCVGVGVVVGLALGLDWRLEWMGAWVGFKSQWVHSISQKNSCTTTVGQKKSVHTNLMYFMKKFFG